MQRTILVTGAGGYIGSVATYLLLQNGYTVIALDNFSTGFREPLDILAQKYGNSQFRWYETDLVKNPEIIFQKEKKIDAVLHYAASCLVDESMKNPQKYFANNVCGTQKLLAAMLENNVNTLIFSSTCAVYGEEQYMPMDERHPFNPTTPYGASKRMVEQLIEWYGKLRGLRYMVLRYFNVCGASDDGLFGDSKKPSTLLVQNAVRGALGIEPFYLTYPEVDTPDKSPIRDYVNVADLNDAHVKALEYLFNNGASDILNLGTGTGNSVLEIVNQVQSITGKRFPLKKTTPRQGDDARKIAAIDKAKKVLGWTPKRTVKDSVNSLVKWYNAHPYGWEK